MATKSDYFKLKAVGILLYTCLKCDKQCRKIWATDEPVNNDYEKYICTKCLNKMFDKKEEK